jgi:hypothetical protein
MFRSPGTQDRHGGNAASWQKETWHMIKTFSLACALSVSAAITLSTAQSRSAPLAKELSGVLLEKKLDAIAAVDPADDQRFVAALFFPNVQLLVVSARYPAPALLAEQLTQKVYGEVYGALHGASVRETKLFIQDMGADGIHPDPGQSVDVVYERDVTQILFDGHPEKRDTSKAAYAEHFQRLDDSYSRMLKLLIAEARK